MTIELALKLSLFSALLAAVLGVGWSIWSAYKRSRAKRLLRKAALTDKDLNELLDHLMKQSERELAEAKKIQKQGTSINRHLANKVSEQQRRLVLNAVDQESLTGRKRYIKSVLG